MASTSHFAQGLRGVSEADIVQYMAKKGGTIDEMRFKFKAFPDIFRYYTPCFYSRTPHISKCLASRSFRHPLVRAPDSELCFRDHAEDIPRRRVITCHDVDVEVGYFPNRINNLSSS